VHYINGATTLNVPLLKTVWKPIRCEWRKVRLLFQYCQHHFWSKLKLFLFSHFPSCILVFLNITFHIQIIM